jgi:group II intron reverse transcriptase/maturase
MATTPEKIRNFQRKLYLVSKQNEDYRFYSLYDKVYRMDVPREAYKRCKANRGAPGVDGVTFQDIERAGLQAFLAEVAEALRTRRYEPMPIRRVMIPKPDGRERPLGISIIRDRVVQAACKIVLEPIFEPHLHEQSFGCRPRRRAQEAIRAIEAGIKGGHVHVYDADLSGYFDSIPHQPLMEKLARRVSDKQILALVRRMLKAPVQTTDLKGRKHYLATTMGVPQGNVLSPLMANVYLNDFCLMIAKLTPCKIVTYADDFVILHKKRYTQKQLDWFETKLQEEGLTINAKKTRVVDMRELGSDFDFLGFNFKKVRGFYRNTQYVKIQPSRKSRKKLKDAIRQIVKHRTSRTLDELIAKVNPIIRGWYNYFRGTGYPRQVFFKLDWFIVARFYRWSKRLSQRRCKRLTQDAWKTLRLRGLIFFQPVRQSHVKGT